MLGTSSPSTNSALPMPVPSVTMITTPRHALARAERPSRPRRRRRRRSPRSPAPPIAAPKQLRRVGADPRLVDVRRGVRDAVLHRPPGRWRPSGPVQSKNFASSPTTAADRLGRRRVRGEDAVTVGEQLPAARVDGRTLDAGAADVDAEHCGHGVILARRMRCTHPAKLRDTGGNEAEPVEQFDVDRDRRRSGGREHRRAVRRLRREHRGGRGRAASAASARTGRACRARCCSGRARCWPRCAGCRARPRRSPASSTWHAVLAWRDDIVGELGRRRPGGVARRRRRRARARARPAGRRTARRRRARRRRRCASSRRRKAVVLATGSSRGDAADRRPARRSARGTAARTTSARSTCPSDCSCSAAASSACEMAQAWKRLGAREVTVVDQAPSASSPHLEPFAGEQLQATFEAEGITVVLGAKAVRAERDGADDGPVTLTLDDGRTFTGDELLVAVGRRPNTADLGLDAVGLEPGEADRGRRPAPRHRRRRRVALRDRRRQRPRAAHAHGQVPGAHRRRRDPAGIDASRRGPTTARCRASCSPIRSSRRSGSPRRRRASRGSTCGSSATAPATSPARRCTARGSTGTSQLVVDDARRVIVGATFTGPGVGEMLHAATIAVAGEVPLDMLWHAVPVVPDDQRGLAPPPRGVRPVALRIRRRGAIAVDVEMRVSAGHDADHRDPGVARARRALRASCATSHLRDLFAADPTGASA